MARNLKSIVAQLELDEKATLLAGAGLWSTAGVARLGIAPVTVTDGPNGARGPVLPAGFGDDSTLTSLCLPSGAALGATWDVALVEQVGEVIGAEARLKACRVLLAPTVNLHRSPLGGRNFESYAEDPLLAGRMGAAFVRGAQRAGVACTVKHFAGNESEDLRMVADSVIDERTLREVHLLAFELAVREGGALGIMTSYNRLNGQYCAESEWLLRDVLRGEWGFEGFVVTDWFAFADTARALQAGLDLEMPGPGRAYGPALAVAVRSGEVDEALVDAALLRLLEVFDRIGALDDDPRVAPRSDDVPAHRVVARRASVASMVLLKNDGVLPLDSHALRRVAVIGPNAARAVIMGGGSASLAVHELRTPLDALRDRLGADVEVVHEPGVGSDAAIARAVGAALAADAVIVVVGTDGEWETEGRDRDSMTLPGQQEALIERMLAVAPNAVVVLNAGSVVTVPFAPRCRALLQCWFGGMEMAEALVDVLFGDADPGGRLPTTIPHRLEDTPSWGTFPHDAGTTIYGERVLVGHRWYESRRIDVAFPFGHGLSYTRFAIGTPTVTAGAVDGAARAGGTSVNGAPRFVVRVPVTNVGERAGSEVVQLYVAARSPRAFRPPKELKAFAKVTLSPGEQTVVELALDDRSFAYWSAATPTVQALMARQAAEVPFMPGATGVANHGWTIDPGAYDVKIGRSSADIVHVITIEVADQEMSE